jgi:hypothetical protein
VRAAENALEIAWPEGIAEFIEGIEQLEVRFMRHGLREIARLLPKIVAGETLTDEELAAFRPPEPEVVTSAHVPPRNNVVLFKVTPLVEPEPEIEEPEPEEPAPEVEESESDVLRSLADDLMASKNAVHRSAVGLLFDLAERLDGGMDGSAQRVKDLEHECHLLREQLDDLADFIATLRGEIRADERVVDVAIGLIKAGPWPPTITHVLDAHQKRDVDQRTEKERLKERDRRRGLLARMAGNIAAGVWDPTNNEQSWEDVARSAVETAKLILNKIEED